jgi:hypothetical protein
VSFGATGPLHAFVQNANFPVTIPFYRYAIRNNQFTIETLGTGFTGAIQDTQSRYKYPARLHRTLPEIAEKYRVIPATLSIIKTLYIIGMN